MADNDRQSQTAKEEKATEIIEATLQTCIAPVKKELKIADIQISLDKNDKVSLFIWIFDLKLPFIWSSPLASLNENLKTLPDYLREKESRVSARWIREASK